MEKLLTISVAAYNVEQYLEQTLASLNDSRFLDDIEVLVVDDGSKDGTKDIALKYQAMAPDTFRYVGKENGGHGSTINMGMKLATGKYFRVLDGDDWVDTNGFARYIEALSSSDADLVLTQLVRVKGAEEKLRVGAKGMESGRVYTWDDDIYVNQTTLGVTTIKTSLLKENGVHITENCYYVDMEFTIWMCALSRTIQSLDIPVYMYRVGTVTQSTNKNNRIKNIAMQEKVSRSVTLMYEQFRKKDDFRGLKRDVIFRRVAQSVGATVRSYLLMDDAAKVKENVARFEESIRALSQDVYDELGKSRFFRFLRYKNYMLLPVMSRAFKVWIKLR